jgi:hypothetical protein
MNRVFEYQSRFIPDPFGKYGLSKCVAAAENTLLGWWDMGSKLATA